MAISVTGPFGPAYERTKYLLFRPFDLGKWFVLGFCAWLAELGQGGVNFPNLGDLSPSGPGPGPAPGPDVRGFIMDHLAIILVVGLIAITGIFAIYLLFRWLNARGQFMFLDGVVHNRGRVVEPWRRLKAPANSFFWLRIILETGIYPLYITVVLLPLLLIIPDVSRAWPNLDRLELTAPSWIGIGLAAPSLLVSFFVVAIVHASLDAFVIPIMYCRNLKAYPAFKLFFRELFFPHLGAFILYDLMVLVLVMGTGILVGLAVCVTCCLGYIVLVLPYIGTVAMLPILVFFRHYSLYFLQQFGPHYHIVPDDMLPPAGGFPVIPLEPARSL